MKTTLILIVLGFSQPSLTDNQTFVEVLTAQTKVLAEKNNGLIEPTTSQLIDWLYSKGGFTEPLSEGEVVVLKDIVRLACASKTAKRMAEASPQKRFEAALPPKTWYDNVRLSLTYSNGVTRPYSLTMYGYNDPTTNVFVFDPAEQTEDVKRLLNSPLPAIAASRPTPQYYYYQVPKARPIGRS